MIFFLDTSPHSGEYGKQGFKHFKAIGREWRPQTCRAPPGVATIIYRDVPMESGRICNVWWFTGQNAIVYQSATITVVLGVLASPNII